MAVETMSMRPRVAKSDLVLKWFWRVAITASLSWTVYSYRHLRWHSFDLHNIRAAFDTLFDRLPGLAVLFVIFEVCFCLGAAMMIWGLGRKVKGAGRQDVGWYDNLKQLHSQIKELVSSDSTSQLYRWGLYLNWAGAAMTTGVIPIIAIIWLFPSNRWGGLMGVPATDLIATFVWRFAARPRKQVAV